MEILTLLSLNWLAIILLFVCLHGVVEHALALRESKRDVAAMKATKHNGYLLKGVKSDVFEEAFRLIAKLSMAFGYTMSIFTVGTILDKDDWRSITAFLLQLMVLGSLSISTHIRRTARRAMIREAMAARARNNDPLEDHY